jgi:hypothetical protein
MPRKPLRLDISRLSGMTLTMGLARAITRAPAEKIDRGEITNAEGAAELCIDSLEN